MSSIGGEGEGLAEVKALLRCGISSGLMFGQKLECRAEILIEESDRETPDARETEMQGEIRGMFILRLLREREYSWISTSTSTESIKGRL